MPPELASLSGVAVAVLVLGGMLIGFSKTSFGGIGAVAAVLFALVMPAKESTAAVLLLLLVGDVIGIRLYGRHASWKLILRLVPTVIAGLLVGALFMRYVDDVLMRRTIGALLVISVALQVWQRVQIRTEEMAPEGGPHPIAAGAAGVAAGFSTMTANAAGPIMALYLLANRIDKKRFIGTNAWFFGAINLAKTPLSGALGLFTPQVLWVWVAMVPAVLIGAWIGRLVIGRVDQRQFENVTLAAAALSSVVILLR